MSIVRSCVRLFAAGATMYFSALCVAATDTADTITSTVEDIAVTGTVWSTVSPNREPVIGAAGLRDGAASTPMETDTRVFIGSITKSLLATGVLKLVSEDRLQLDTPVINLLPGLEVQNPWRDTTPVTIRHLLDHTAGLEGARLRQGFDNRATPDTPLQEAFKGAPITVRSKPGERASYSNMGYTLLGMIIEAVTNERYEEYLKRELLVPLDMRDSSFHYRTPEAGAFHDDRLAWGHTPRGQHATIRPILMRPAGQFITTATDMAKFMTFLLSDGSVKGQPFIRSDLMQQRGTPQTTISAQSGLRVGYSLGLARVEIGGSMALCHDGQIQGYLAQMCVFPADGKGFFFSVNMNNPRANLKLLADALADTLDLTPAHKSDAQPLPADIADWTGVYLPAPFRNSWSALPEMLTRPVKLGVQGDTLMMAAGMRPPMTLRHIADHRFAIDDWASASHVLARGENGIPMLIGPSSTFEKTSPLIIHGHRISVLLGLLGLLWVLVCTPVVIVRERRRILDHPMVPLITAVLVNMIIVFLLASRPIDGIGALNATTSFIAVGTLLLPVAAVLSLMRLRQWTQHPKIRVAHGIAAFAVIQLCGLLAFWGWMPLMTWTM